MAVKIIHGFVTFDPATRQKSKMGLFNGLAAFFGIISHALGIAGGGSLGLGARISPVLARPSLGSTFILLGSLWDGR